MSGLTLIDTIHITVDAGEGGSASFGRIREHHLTGGVAIRSSPLPVEPPLPTDGAGEGEVGGDCVHSLNHRRWGGKEK